MTLPKDPKDPGAGRAESDSRYLDSCHIRQPLRDVTSTQEGRGPLKGYAQRSQSDALHLCGAREPQEGAPLSEPGQPDIMSEGAKHRARGKTSCPGHIAACCPPYPDWAWLT